MTTKKALAALALAAMTVVPALAAELSVPNIPYQKFVLDNGLTVLVHEDHKAPIVAVNVWYHVGSKNEKPGRTGFAHLFEHLMFNGSENFNDDYFKATEKLGATDLNGTTNNDRTNYFQNVPKSALDTILWLESDRMGHLVGVIDQPRLDEQRGVVQNEKRQGDNEPYSLSEELIAKACFPVGHPYNWTVIGSMEDLDAAKLDDVKEWFKTYYGPNNAILVIAGDVTAKDAVDKVKHYFGDIPPGPPIGRSDQWVAKRTGSARASAQDRVPQTRIMKMWNVPGQETRDRVLLDLAANVLSSGKTSRLYKRLVYDDQTATSAIAYTDSREIASLFTLQADVKKDGDPAKVEAAMDEELAKFLKDGPTADELERTKTETFAGFIRGIERIGGFGGKSDVLAAGYIYGGDPDRYKINLDIVKNATPAQVKEAAQKWLSDGVYILQIDPYPSELKAAATGADRKKMPEGGAAPAVVFPAVEKTTLSNGMKLLVARREAIPVTDFDLILDAGTASDATATPGTASLAMAMLDEGTKTRSSLQISDEAQRLGANIGTGSNLDNSTVSLSALNANLDKSLDLFADIVLHPSFPETDFKRLQKQQIARIQREKSQPVGMALRVLPKLLYGNGHPYALPFSGSGYEDTVAKLTRDDLIKFHQTWFKPNNATMIVVGNTTMAEIKPKLEALFKDWAKGTVPVKKVSQVAAKNTSTVYILDKPGAAQSVIIAGQVVAPTANPDEITFKTMNQVLGGSFVSRINMDLREDKHWSYGSYSFVPDARGQRPFIGYAPVQTDKTKESMVEVMAQLKGIVGGKPITAGELEMAQDGLTKTLPGQWETQDAVSGSIADMVNYGLPDDYYTTFPNKVRALKTSDLIGNAQKTLNPDKMVWVVVGDRAKIEAGIKDLKYGEVKYLDPDGNPK
ncbi:MAG TPA: pitrilysin family protein [Candidatus Polarisedimenticolaceae bacterium]|nr:pitrilysin family protein [Candidatus Polarisedimenticolaceae bacterium]